MDITLYLNLIADVDDKSVGNRLNGDPSMASANLKALDPVIGQEHGYAARIRMRGEAESQVRLGALGVEIDPHTNTHVVPAERLLQEILLQSQPRRQHLHHSSTQLYQFLAILLRGLPADRSK